MNFINHYLSNTCNYSFCESDVYGNTDSAGQRGAMTLFLYWLFEKAGGMKQDGIDLVDKGGISFLRTMTNSTTYGWECIGEHFKTSTDRLLMNFFEELLKDDFSEIFRVTDKDSITNDHYIENATLKVYSAGEIRFILPKSFISLSTNSASTLELDSNSLQENLYIYTILEK